MCFTKIIYIYLHVYIHRRYQYNIYNVTCVCSSVGCEPGVMMCTDSSLVAEEGYITSWMYPGLLPNSEYICRCYITTANATGDPTVDIIFSNGSLCHNRTMCTEELSIDIGTGNIYNSCTASSVCEGGSLVTGINVATTTTQLKFTKTHTTNSENENFQLYFNVTNNIIGKDKSKKEDMYAIHNTRHQLIINPFHYQEKHKSLQHFLSLFGI